MPPDTARWKKVAALAGLTLACAAWPTLGWAMFKCTDVQGKVSYQEQPCAPNAQSKPVPNASSRPATAAPRATANANPSGMTVDEFMRNPTPGLDNAPACVKAYDAELSRQWGRPRTEADTRTLAAMREACPELSLSPPRSPDQRARDAAQTQQLKDHERRDIESTLRATRELCAPTSRPAGDQRPRPSAQDCAQEIQRLEAALQRQPR